LVEFAIEQHIDADVLERTQEIGQAERETFRDFINRWDKEVA
jgi:hypothetical protein